MNTQVQPVNKTRPIEIADLLVQYRQAKDDMTKLRVALCEIAVNEYGIDQSRAPQVCESFFDGLLVGKGIMQTHRKKEGK